MFLASESATLSFESLQMYSLSLLLQVRSPRLKSPSLGFAARESNHLKILADPLPKIAKWKGTILVAINAGQSAYLARGLQRYQSYE